MSLKQWADNGWLRPHQASRQEVADLLSIVDRDLDDAAKTAISADWRFGIAYNAAYLEACRKKRNTVEYDVVGAATPGDADELLALARALRGDVLAWLAATHPDMAP